jgi:hypothetical protein
MSNLVLRFIPEKHVQSETAGIFPAVSLFAEFASFSTVIHALISRVTTTPR